MSGAVAIQASPKRGFVLGLACRECGNSAPMQPVHVCELCFGPLEIRYDYAAIGTTTWAGSFQPSCSAIS